MKHIRLLILFFVIGLSFSTKGQELKANLVIQVGHTNSIKSVAFSPTGKIIASCGEEGVVKLWDVKTRREIRTLRESCNDIEFSPNGNNLAIGTTYSSKYSVALYDVLTGLKIKNLQKENDYSIYINSISFSPDGKTLASCGIDKSITIWNIETGQKIKDLIGHTIAKDDQRGVIINSLAFSPDGKKIASASDDLTVKLWDVETGKEIKTFLGNTTKVSTIAFSPNGKILASGASIDWSAGSSKNNGKLKLWDVESGNLIHSLEENNVGVYSVAFSPDGKIIASAGSGGTIKLWNAANGELVNTLEENGTASTEFVAFSPKDNLLVSVGGNRTINLWDLKNLPELQEIIGHDFGLNTASFSEIYGQNSGYSSQANIAAIGNQYNEIELWDTLKAQRLFTLKRLNGKVAISPNGKLLAVGSSNVVGGVIKIFDVKTGEETKTLNISEGAETKSLAFSPDNKILAVGFLSYIKLVEVETERIISLVEASNRAIKFSSDGKLLATASRNIEIRNGFTGQIIKTLICCDSEINSVAFSLDSKMLVSGGVSKSVDLWDLETSQKIESFNGHSDTVISVSFSPDDKFVSSRSFDLTQKLWSLKTKSEVFSLITLNKADWVIVTPEGRFDTNKNLDNIEGLHWIISDDLLNPKSLDVFMRQYYEPNLLQRILKCNEENNCDKEFKPLPSIAVINRVQPKVLIRDVKASVNAKDVVDVTVEVESVSEDVSVSADDRTKKKRETSGVFDLRIFLDGQLVGVSTPKEKLAQFIIDAPRLVTETNASGKLLDTPEDKAWRETNDISKLKNENIKLLSDGKIQYTFRNIKLPKDGRKEVDFTAYAFNSDRVKSNTAQSKFNVSEAISAIPRKGRAVVVSIGVNASEIPKFNLRYAANDAKKMQEIVGARLSADDANYSEVISIPLISDYDADKKVTDNNARKAVIKAAFSLLAGDEKEIPAEILAQIPNREKIKAIQPEDTLIITYAGHGYADQNGIFYLLPYDVGTNSEDLTAVLNRSISSDELSLWMLDITAREMIFIVDACNSAAAVQGSGFKPGPMGSRGLGQLAYDKGMRILAATQADNVALELNKLQQGLLSYALLQNGIVEKKADTEADFNQLSAKEWLIYGVKRVPEIYEEVKAGKRTIMVDGNSANVEQSRLLLQQQTKQKSAVNLQQPTLFDFSRSKDNRSLLLLP